MHLNILSLNIYGPQKILKSLTFSSLEYFHLHDRFVGRTHYLPYIISY